MIIDPRLLRYLRVITQCGTYREAAERLNVTQPMLSKGIQQLEHQLGVQVLTRGRHGALPTVFGERLVAKSKIIDIELAKLLADIDELKGVRSGHVRVGAVPPLTTRLMPAVIQLMKAQYPDVLIGLDERSTRPLTEGLLAGDYDLVVGGFGFEQVSTDIEEEFLFSSPAMVLVGRDHPFAGGAEISLRELHPYPWVSPKHSSLAASELLALLSAARIEPFKTSMETDSLPTLRALLLDGKHFALNTPEILANDIDAGSIVALKTKEAVTVWRFALKRRRDAFETPAMRCFAKCLKSVLKEYPGAASRD